MGLSRLGGDIGKGVRLRKLGVRGEGLEIEDWWCRERRKRLGWLGGGGGREVGLRRMGGDRRRGEKLSRLGGEGAH